MNEQLLQGVQLSPLQKRIWLLQDESPVYFQQYTVAVTGRLDTKRLEDCFYTVIGRHEILRTSYPKQPGLAYPLQAVSDAVSFTLQPGPVATSKEWATPDATYKFEEDQPLQVSLFSYSDEQHELRLTLPAIAGDDFTLQQIIREIAGAYNENGAEPQEAIQYGQFSEWQQELFASPDEFATEYWEKYPYRQANEYALPFCNYNVEGGAFKPRRVPVIIADEVWDRLDRLDTAQRNNTHLVAAAFGTLLRRFTDGEAITIGYTIAGREYEELQKTMGLLARTLPLVMQYSDEHSLLSLADHVAAELNNSSDYSDYFSWKNTDSRPAYFRSLFEYSDIKSPAAGTATFSIKDTVSVTDRFAIKLSLVKTDGKNRLELYYDSAELNEQAATAFADQLSTLLEESSKTPEENCTTVAAHSTRQEIFPGDPDNAEPVAKNIVQLFEAAAKRCPKAVAVQEKNTPLTYEELQEKAARFASYLTWQCGVKKGDIVALRLQRSASLIITMMGILKAGAAYLPVDYKTPPARINYILDDSQSVLFVTDEQTGITGVQAKAIVVNPGFWETLQPAEPLQMTCCAKCNKTTEEKLACQINRGMPKSSDIAYVIYTSGSTGKPKGVLVTHGSLANYAQWFIAKYGITEADRSLLFSSVAFDLCYTSLWSSLLSGAGLYIHPEAEWLDPVSFTGDLIENGITFIKLTPSHFNLIARDPEFETNSKKYNLRLIVLGGEEIIAEDVEEYLRYNPSVQFVNHYGPTEATIGILTKNIDAKNISLFRRKTVLGKSNAGNHVFIVNENNGRICAVGQTGEICVSGKGLAAGYLNRRELTDEKFTTGPLPGYGLMYRTGDLGRWMPDGNIEFLGRRDFQVKLRGYRIETGEIEEVMLSYPGVEDASVQLFQPEGAGEKQLIAFVKTKEKIKAKIIGEYMQAKLPHYMIPSDFISLPAFPLLANGKLDRNALLELASQYASAAEYVAPRNNTEQLLVKIWQEVLGADTVGIRDSFFDLGGHSLKAAQIVSRVYKTCNKKIELKAIFDNPTIEQLAAIIQATGYNQYESIPVVPEMDYYEVSHAQKRLWILNHFQREKISYNSASYYQVTGDARADVLQAAFEELISRHESLRTTFIAIDGIPWQKINTVAGINFKLELADVSGETDPDAAAEALALANYNKQFDLENGPLLRAMFIKLRNNVHLLVCNMHHIVYDGWSLKILFSELLTIYNAFVQGGENPLPPLAIQYKDYSAWHNAIIKGEDEQYWLQKLANPPGLVNFPYDKIDNPDAIPYSRHDVLLSAEETQVMRDIAAAYNCTLSSLFLGIYGLFINQVSGQQDVVVGIGHANRNHADTEKLIGFFVNMLIIRMRFSEDDTLEQVIRQIADNSVEAFQHSNYPFDLLIEKLCTNRYADRQPILNVMYDFKNFSDVALQEDISLHQTDLQIDQLRIGDPVSTHDLILHLVDAEENIIYFFEYKKDCFLPETVKNFYSIFYKLIRLVAKELAPAPAAAAL